VDAGASRTLLEHDFFPRFHVTHRDFVFGKTLNR
jgi:hypothetical protein